MESAACAKHPDRIAAQTCARCGSFMCGECVSEDVIGHCRECASRLEQSRVVAQVPWLAIVMMIHGVFFVGAALIAFLYGPIFAHSYQTQGTEPAPDDPLSGLIFAGSVIAGLVLLVPGVLQIWAGALARTYRARAFAISALLLSLIGCMGIYCIPTTLGLMVWGLVVLFNDDVAARFAATRSSAR
jgi:hypothetical protein